MAITQHKGGAGIGGMFAIGIGVERIFIGLGAQRRHFGRGQDVGDDRTALAKERFSDIRDRLRRWGGKIGNAHG